MLNFVYDALVLLLDSFGMYFFIPVLLIAFIATVPLIIRSFFSCFGR